MRFKINRHGIEIAPDCDEDIAYIEDTLGLKTDDSFVKLVRKNAFGMSCIAYLQTERAPQEITVLSGVDPKDSRR